MTFRERDREASNDTTTAVPTALMTEEEPVAATILAEEEAEERPVREEVAALPRRNRFVRRAVGHKKHEKHQQCQVTKDAIGALRN